MTDYREIIAGFKDVPGGLIEAYHAIQRQFSYLPEEAIIAAAELLGLPVCQAYGVATFYSMFSVRPRGKNVVRICESAPCHIAGAAAVVEAFERELGVKMGYSTSDGKFALEFTQCVGQCQDCVVVTINGKPLTGVTPAKVPAMLAEYQ
ncbi:MAG: NAD(P)H-dependent oxidoreductase subunit E [Methylocystaceae bacterium]